jgi:hypothetical protein
MHPAPQLFQVQGGIFRIGGDGYPPTQYILINGLVPAQQGRLQKQMIGAQIEIAFEPSNDIQVISKEIQTVSLVQIVQDTVQINLLAGGGVVPRQHNIGFGTFAVPLGTPHAGWTIDQDVFDKVGAVKNRDPRYTQSRRTAADPIVTEDPKRGPRIPDIAPGVAGLPSSGFSIRRGIDGRFKGCALLRDQPTVTYDPATQTVAGGMAFEIAVLSDGTKRQPAAWLGSITWGWNTGPAGPALTPIAVVAQGPSPAFIAAVAQWNNTPAGGAAMLPLP